MNCEDIHEEELSFLENNTGSYLGYFKNAKCSERPYNLSSHIDSIDINFNEKCSSSLKTQCQITIIFLYIFLKLYN